MCGLLQYTWWLRTLLSSGLSSPSSSNWEVAPAVNSSAPSCLIVSWPFKSQWKLCVQHYLHIAHMRTCIQHQSAGLCNDKAVFSCDSRIVEYYSAEFRIENDYAVTFGFLFRSASQYHKSACHEPRYISHYKNWLRVVPSEFDSQRQEFFLFAVTSRSALGTTRFPVHSGNRRLFQLE
jgi:hypothetical protein